MVEVEVETEQAVGLEMSHMEAVIAEVVFAAPHARATRVGCGGLRQARRLEAGGEGGGEGGVEGGPGGPGGR